MKFDQLKKAIQAYEAKHHSSVISKISNPLLEQKQEFQKPVYPFLTEKRQTLVGGVVKYKPIDKTAARVVSKAPWWATLIELRKNPIEKTKSKRKNKMRTHIKSTTGPNPAPLDGVDGDYISGHGIKVVMVNGQPMMDLNSVKAVIIAEIEKLPLETRGPVRAAEDARKILDELFLGIGSDFEKFKATTKIYLDEIRQTRFAIVTECAAMSNPLKEIRQFFLGSNYNEEITRLKEFVDLCERLQKLKEAGFLDRIADTMLSLAIK